jgi:hypothetical protein
VTRDFGTKKLVETSSEANESDTVMRFLEKEVEIETRYGGGYVKSIDGLEESNRGGHPYDWFFWVNGVISPTGAAEVPLEGGEKIWWDIHDWSASEGSPAVVGSWPAPFTTGWEGHAPVVVVECDGGGAACGSVTKSLEGEGVKVASWSPKSAIRVLVGPWSQVRSDPAAGLVDKGPGESGIYAEFESSQGTDRLVGLDEDGDKARTFGTNAGLVAATRHFEGPPVWLVTGGTDAMYLSRKRLLMPSASTTRSASAKRASSSMSASKISVTPSSRARCCRISSSWRREQPQKPLPPTRCTVSRKCTAISSQ